jgi:hypothetical protein
MVSYLNSILSISKTNEQAASKLFYNYVLDLIVDNNYCQLNKVFDFINVETFPLSLCIGLSNMTKHYDEYLNNRIFYCHKLNKQLKKINKSDIIGDLNELY